jgi:N-acetylmuramic acid 6-phosphate etherase
LKKTTEQESKYQKLEQLSTLELLTNINTEDQTVPMAIAAILDRIEGFVDATSPKMNNGGRLFYLGAGTSGRLGVVDASECPPTFGVSFDTVIGIMAGGDKAMRKAVEFAEDDSEQGWKDLQEFKITSNDTVVGIAASGTTPYVIGVLKTCQENNITTACITCNADSPVSAYADHKLEAIVGPEFVTGSTRMKAGTAQKLILNMISTALMIKKGHVKGNRMVDMQLSNDKLVDRGTNMVMQETGAEYETAKALLLQHGSVRKAVEAYFFND